MREKGKKDFDIQALQIKERHRNQNIEQISFLKEKYKKPVFGLINPWNLIEKLAFCVDPTDRELYGVSQLIHTIQVLDAMEKDGIKDEYFLLAGLFHDIGKILLLTDELPENIVCDNGVVGSYSEGVGLDQCIQHWNHDEFAYNRLKNYLPYPMTWLIRYHSLKITEEIKRYMNHSDKDLADKYYARFKNYDKLTKSIFHIPKIDIEKYRRLTEKLLPNFIEI